MKWGDIPVKVGEGPRDMGDYHFNQVHTPGIYFAENGSDITLFYPDRDPSLALTDDLTVELNEEFVQFEIDIRDLIKNWIFLFENDHKNPRQVVIDNLENLIKELQGQ